MSKDPIHPIDKALPKEEGGHALVLRERHDLSSHITYLRTNLQKLKNENNVGTIALELPPYLMLPIWMYRDAKTPEEKLKAGALLEESFNAFSKDAMADRAKMAMEAIDAGIDVVTFDSRYCLAEHKAETMRNLQANWAELAQVSEQQPTSDHTKLHELIGAQKREYESILALEQYYAAHPEYRAKLDSIEQTIQQMREKKIPADIISANIADALSDRSENLITVSGAGHINGERVMQPNVFGIFDEGLAFTGWKTTDAVIGNSSDIAENIVRELIGIVPELPSFKQCYTADHVDFVWDTEKNVVAYPPLKARKGAEVLIPGLEYDVFSCVDAPAVEKQFTPQELRPCLQNDLCEAINKLRTAFAAPALPAATETPVVKQQR